MRIAIHIDRLVLDGLPVTAAQGADVRAAVESELASMLAREGLPPMFQHGGALPRVPAPAVALGAGQRADAIGGRIAKSLYAGLGGTNEGPPRHRADQAQRRTDP